jgi:dTMP kinase
MSKYGRLLMFDGPDGVGKTEQIGLIADSLRNDGHDIHLTRVHGGTPIGELLRDVSLSSVPRTALTDLLISQAIHAELAADIAQRRAAGTTCLVDRSPASMWSYQVCASGLSPQQASPVIESDFALFNPDLVLIYVAELDVLRNRLAGRPGSKRDYFESQPDTYHQKVIDGYIQSAALFGGVLIDASGTKADVYNLGIRKVNKIIAPKY